MGLFLSVVSVKEAHPFQKGYPNNCRVVCCFILKSLVFFRNVNDFAVHLCCKRNSRYGELENTPLGDLDRLSKPSRNIRKIHKVCESKNFEDSVVVFWRKPFLLTFQFQTILTVLTFWYKTHFIYIISLLFKKRQNKQIKNIFLL